MQSTGFLVLYLVIMVAAGGWLVVLARRARHTTTDPDTVAHTAGDLTAVEVGHLRGGPHAALSAAVAALRARGTVAVLRHRRVARTVDAVPPDLPPLDSAILHAAAHPVTLGVLRSDDTVREQLRMVDDRLTGAGLVPAASQRRQMGSGLAVLFLLGLPGLFGLAPGGRQTVLSGAVAVVLAVAAALLVSRWGLLRRTAAGEAVLRVLGQRYAHLRPDGDGLPRTGDPQHAAMTVALFNVDAVPPVAPGFGLKSSVDMPDAGGS